MKILIIDNYDSFVYNLYRLVLEVCDESDTVDILKNDQLDFTTISTYHKILISPGPGIPSEAGQLADFLKIFSSTKSILGICLGFQAIAETYGAKLVNLPKVYHGIQSQIKIVEPCPLFDGVEEPFYAGRYHSWGVACDSCPADLTITAKSDDDYVMAFSHKRYDVHGVQFHPESFLTPSGNLLIQNFLYPGND